MFLITGDKHRQRDTQTLYVPPPKMLHIILAVRLLRLWSYVTGQKGLEKYTEARNTELFLTSYLPVGVQWCIDVVDKNWWQTLCVCFFFHAVELKYVISPQLTTEIAKEWDIRLPSYLWQSRWTKQSVTTAATVPSRSGGPKVLKQCL